MTVDSNWQVIVRGEATAYSYNNDTGHKTYASAPPILAVRPVGKGRLVLFPSYSTETVVNGRAPRASGNHLDPWRRRHAKRCLPDVL